MKASILQSILSILFFSFSSIVMAQTSYSDSEVLCINQYLLKEYDVAFFACLTAAKEQPTYVNLSNIGNMYLRGWGVEKDVPRAIKYFEQATSYSGSDGSAEHNLGFAYANGIGVEQDKRKAFDLYMKAAMLGNEESQFNLGTCYLGGDGVSINYSEGYAWLLVAKKNGLTGATKKIQYVDFFT